MRPITTKDQLQGQRAGCWILTVDPETKTVNARLGNGEPIVIWVIHSNGPTFRWPKQGERWIIEYQNGLWYLIARYEDTYADMQLSQLPFDTARIDATAIKTRDNKDVVATKQTAQDQQALVWDDATSTWVPQQVGSAGLAPGAVQNSNLAPNAVQGSNIAPNAVQSSNIAPAAVQGSNLASQSVDSSKLANLVWTNLTLQNGWTASGGTPQYAQNGSMVLLRGSLGTGTVNQALATLPAGLRPTSDQWFSVVTSGSAISALVVHPDGTIVLTTGTATFLSIDGVRVTL